MPLKPIWNSKQNTTGPGVTVLTNCAFYFSPLSTPMQKSTNSRLTTTTKAGHFPGNQVFTFTSQMTPPKGQERDEDDMLPLETVVCLAGQDWGLLCGSLYYRKALWSSVRKFSGLKVSSQLMATAASLPLRNKRKLKRGASSFQNSLKHPLTQWSANSSLPRAKYQQDED